MLNKLSSNSINLIHILSFLRKKIIRKGIWYKTLNNEERVLVNMISRYIKIVRNPKLAYIVAKMISKLLLALKDGSMKKVIIGGLKHLELWSKSAKRYGWNISNWFDSKIVRWLGIFSLSFK